MDGLGDQEVRSALDHVLELAAGLVGSQRCAVLVMPYEHDWLVAGAPCGDQRSHVPLAGGVVPGAEERGIVEAPLHIHHNQSCSIQWDLPVGLGGGQVRRRVHSGLSAVGGPPMSDDPLTGGSEGQVGEAAWSEPLTSA